MAMDSFLSRELAEAAAVELREYKSELADKVIVVQGRDGYDVMVGRDSRMCRRCNGSGYIPGQDMSLCSANPLFGSPDCDRGLIKVST